MTRLEPDNMSRQQVAAIRSHLQRLGWSPYRLALLYGVDVRRAKRLAQASLGGMHEERANLLEWLESRPDGNLIQPQNAISS
jgi:hypothetical protein